MEISEFLNKPLPEIPPGIRAALHTDSSVTLTEFGMKNKLLTDKALQREFGFARFDNGNYLVSMTCPMPGITPEMIRWWFRWHAQESIRYRIWFPGEHYVISTARGNRAYFTEKTLPDFQPNTHYHIERIGKLVLPLKIAFCSPEDFGFFRP